MAVAKTPLEQKLFATLRHICNFDTPARLRKNAERDYGLDGDEVIEMAYENIQTAAKAAIKGIRLATPLTRDAGK